MFNRMSILGYQLAFLALSSTAPVVVARGQTSDADHLALLAVRPTSDPQRLALLERVRFDRNLEIWSDEVEAEVFDVRATPAGRAALDRLHIDYSITVPDLDALYDDYFNRVATGDFFEDYATYEEYAGFLHELADRFPDLATIVSVGKSVEGRSLWMLRITGPGAKKPGIMYQAAQHGHEIISPPVVAYLAKHLLENYATDKSVRALVDGAEWNLIPICNPDGYVRGSRYNADGKDLNMYWREDDSTPAEVLHLIKFMEANPHLAVHLDIHAYNNLLLWPWAGTSDFCFDHWTYSQESERLSDLIYAYRNTRYRGMNGRRYSGGGYGQALDFVYGHHDMFSFVPVLGTSNLMPPEEIRPTCRELLPALLSLGARVVDCNGNGTADWSEIHDHGAADCNGNYCLDECEFPLDCNADEAPDFCELRMGKTEDCNGNATPDSCDIKNNTSRDQNRNRVPDDCEYCRVPRIYAPQHDPRLTYFGTAVALTEASLLVGAPRRYDDFHIGAVVAFDLADLARHQILTLENPANESFFGEPLDADGSTLAVRAIHATDSKRTPAIEIYNWDSSKWVWRERVWSMGDNPDGNAFGTALALNGDWLFVGAPEDEPGRLRGAVYVFHREEGAFRYVQVLRMPPGFSSGSFGVDVSVDGTQAWVAVHSEELLAVVYTLIDGSWQHMQTIENGRWGNRVTVRGTSAAVTTTRGLNIYALLNGRWKGAKEFVVGGNRDNKPLLLTDHSLLVSLPQAEGRLEWFSQIDGVWRQTGVVEPVDGGPWGAFGIGFDILDGRLAVGTNDDHVILREQGCDDGDSAELKAACRTDRKGKSRINIRILHGEPDLWVQVRLDGDPRSDALVPLNCFGWGRTTLRGVGPGPHTVDILRCGSSVSTDCP
ncbi:MAG: hypothetical protein FLDDKLPJ_03448 [Phycisphaerae bacterium]|nr:hypothetical protein [Phycisphaerae bacterium]